MGRLILLLLGTLLAFRPMPAQAGPIDVWAAHIAEASDRFGIPEAWIRRVMAAESGGRTMLNGRPITSHAGAMGLMQLMPGTWQAMRAAYGLGADPHVPRDNILAGTAYLRLMYNRFGYPGLFAAYNAGPGAYAAYLSGQRRLPAETRAYVAQVAQVAQIATVAAPGPRPGTPIRTAARQAREAADEPARTLFVLRGGNSTPVDAGADIRTAAAPPPRPGRSLFVALRNAAP